LIRGGGRASLLSGAIDRRPANAKLLGDLGGAEPIGGRQDHFGKRLVSRNWKFEEILDALLPAMGEEAPTRKLRTSCPSFSGPLMDLANMRSLGPRSWPIASAATRPQSTYHWTFIHIPAAFNRESHAIQYRGQLP
jgi:hypothetical protein